MSLLDRRSNRSKAPTQDELDAVRYRKLRAIMGRNQSGSWRAVCRLAAVACYVGWTDFDSYLDDNMGESPAIWDAMP